jgi:hypothetical protein
MKEENKRGESRLPSGVEAIAEKGKATEKTRGWSIFFRRNNEN